MIARGRYLIAGAGCSDCHSTKKFGPQGPAPDSAFLLAGHIEGSQLPPVYKNALKPGDWILLSGDFTAFVGPWGMSFAANLTPDSTTGIGAWTDEIFIKTLRTGKHLGQEGGRAILPPMPWPNLALFTDEDLKCMFAYLHSIPAIKNKVPSPVPPPDVEKMK